VGPPILGRVADYPFPVDASLRRRLGQCVDLEEKLPRTLDALGPVAERDVVLVDADAGLRARQLAGLGARVVALAPKRAIPSLRRALRPQLTAATVTVVGGTLLDNRLPVGSADVVVSFWSAFRGGSDEEISAAERILRPGGRLLVVHEYARDDLSRLWPDERSLELVSWSRRDGWFLRHDFKIRVVHAFWTFPDLDTLRDVAAAVAGSGGDGLLAEVRRPRLSWKVVVYHRARPSEVAPAGA